MTFCVEYKLVIPNLEYKKPKRFIITRCFRRNVNYFYLQAKNQLKEPFIKPLLFCILRETILYKKKYDISLTIHYKKSPQIFLDKFKKIQPKKFEVVKFYTHLEGNLTMNDYFYIRNLNNVNACINIYKYKRPNKIFYRKDLNLFKSYEKSSKHSIVILKLENNTSQEDNEDFCIFNFSNIKGNEELFLYLKERCNLLQVEEDNNMVLIYNYKTLYYQGDICNIQPGNYMIKHIDNFDE